ncbi:MAG: hypothetical protein IJE77_10535 [Thermoguttaceae bacterium]|nr:hypothetical protein [Thermoguttaceae bacterium]MBQ9801079.1 hypothetical protein [Thermoguttaceae bacterium]
MSQISFLSPALLLVVATFAACDRSPATPPPAPPAASTGSVATFELQADPDAPEVAQTLTVYPTEVYVGDVVYLTVAEENRSSETLPWRSLGFPEPFGSIGTLSSAGFSTRYEAISEYPTDLYCERGFEARPLAPGERRIVSRYFCEVPPLEDWNSPFFKELREKLRDAPDGVPCRWTPGYFITPDGERLSVPLIVKERPDAETRRLEDWLAATPERLLPIIDEANRKRLRSEELPPNPRDGVRVAGRSFDPRAFVRFSFRKPNRPNAPRKLTDWRKLEAEFSPSTLRDEIVLTRLQLEYYDAEEGEASDAALKTLVDWLQSRPEPQRDVMSTTLNESRTYLRERRAYDKDFPLNAKNRKLLETLGFAVF